ncbi:hypothetical protein FXF51_10060 [Nonomuraea sp. PA05]|uniref:hypothetical protein n=1 Tax=Nonomuraea sp. PA05 TaxID=2604466 RepID=UPI0011D5CB05|nr:hypothetical protein [Nonomuraea sp. PA05]TYB68844.1 hypothetical protein FXF51_10060 [Nonomuraea sp. PA05]
MLDLKEKYLDLEARVEALEGATVSGVPKLSIAARFDAQYTRISEVGKNINAKIEHECSAIRAEMREGFAAVTERFSMVDERFSTVDERFNTVDERFNTVDERFNTVDERLSTVDERLSTVDERLMGIDERLMGIDERLNAHDQRFDRLETLLVGIDAKLSDARQH